MRLKLRPDACILRTFGLDFYIMSRKEEKERTALSQSFVMGVIALVFLIIGYQTALLIHSSAVAKITANRDEPDTVYIHEAPIDDKKEKNSQEYISERRNSAHSSRAQSVRNKIPRRQVETFRFDPNTVTLEDLCRLGFSEKQAQSIVNYRNKGGRFHRKSDFAESFVVSDSIYKRLEPYVNIPLLDLNLADSAAFDALPGIGGWYAAKMIEHRDRLGGYSFKEQLMDIWRFDEEKYEGLCDLVTLGQEHMTPYPLWELPVDSLRKHPYIGDYAAKGVVIYRENNPKSLWTVDALKKAGIIHPDHISKLERCLIRQP